MNLYPSILFGLAILIASETEASLGVCRDNRRCRRISKALPFFVPPRLNTLISRRDFPIRLKDAPPISSLTKLSSFHSRNDESGYDDDDDEPPDLSSTPKEFLERMKQKEKQSNSNSGNNNSFGSAPAYGPGRGRSAPQIRPAFGKKSSSGGGKAIVYVCTNCGAEYVQWRGRCGTCMEWNTIQEFQASRKPPPLGGGNGGMKPSFGNSLSRGSPGKSGSSWLDGVHDGSFFGNRGNSGSGERGPVRVTDVYQEILPSKDDGDSKSWNDAYSKGSREKRTQVPNDPEINAVLGGGIMPGSITLVGGDPGVGKSTLLLQMAGSIASMAKRTLQYPGIGMGPPRPSPANAPDDVQEGGDDMQQNQDGGPVLYVSGEENANQIASRALRLGIDDPELLLWCETDADVIADTVVNAMYNPTLPWEEDGENQSNNAPPLSRAPSLVIIDSIQTMLCDAAGSSAAGGITQVRECVGLFLRLAKSTGVPIILVGHVTKSGDVAGPRTVEHMVDCVLYLEGGSLLGTGRGSGGGVSSLRIIRAAKNRFGSSEEVGVYEMEGRRGGRLVPVSDPSSFFLSTRLDDADSEGCAISVVLEGIRSMTVEVQALVAWSAGSGAYGGRRIVDGISASRLLLILAVLQKRYGISFFKRDVYVNVVGGMNLGKGSKGGGGSDLAVAVAVVSSLTGIPIRSDTAFVGECGLLGELRPVHSLEKRIGEARRMGFSRIVTPLSGRKKGSRGNSFGPREVSADGIKQIMCDNVLDAINYGLVKKLPTVNTISGPKLKRPKKTKSASSYDDENHVKLSMREDPAAAMSEFDIIIDDEEDNFFE